MKFIVLSDLHLQTKSQTPYAYQTLESVCEYATQNNIQHIFLAGDSFDVELSHYGDFDLLAKRYSHLALVLLKGNHDVSLRSCYFSSANVNVVEEPQFLELADVQIVLAPYQEKSFAELRKDYARIFDTKTLPWRILISHCDYVSVNRSTAFYEEYLYMPMYFKDIEDFNEVILGHVHRRQIVDNKVYYCGSAYPRSSNEYDIRMFGVYDTEFKRLEFLPLATNVVYMNLEVVLSPFETVRENLEKALQSLVLQLGNITWECQVHVVTDIKGISLDKRKDVETIKQILEEKNFVPIIKDNELQVYNDSSKNKINDIILLYENVCEKVDRLNLQDSKIFLRDKNLIQQKILNLILRGVEE